MLEIQNVSIAFGNEQPAVSEFTLSVHEKEKMVIIGETGSGKSVLLLAILRLLPGYAQVNGEIFFHKKALFSMSKKEIAAVRGAKIAYIPQGSGNGLNPLYPVGKQICEAIQKQKRAGKKEARKQMLELLEKFGFENPGLAAASYPFMLSGGMRQRALVAMGIAGDAELILADEPTKGLDTERIAMVIDAFSRLEDRTLLCVTHDLRFARAIASHITVMYASLQIESCSSREFFEAPLHPYSRAMLEALPENGLHANMGFAPPKAEDRIRKGCYFQERCPVKKTKCELEKPPLVQIRNRKVRCWNYADET